MFQCTIKTHLNAFSFYTCISNNESVHCCKCCIVDLYHGGVPGLEDTSSIRCSQDGSCKPMGMRRWGQMRSRRVMSLGTLIITTIADSSATVCLCRVVVRLRQSRGRCLLPPRQRCVFRLTWLGLNQVPLIVKKISDLSHLLKVFCKTLKTNRIYNIKILFFIC